MGRVDDRAHGDGLAAFRVQNQIRRNAQDMQEYLADLGSWEESIKKKDKQLSRKAAASTATTAKPKDTPPIRRSDTLISVNSIPMAEDAEREKSCSGSMNKMEIYHPESISQASVEGTAACTRNHKNSASAASHTYDRGYGKWAKFDVDSALQTIDNEEKGRSSNSGSSESDRRHANVETPQNKATAPARGVARQRSCPRPSTAPRRSPSGVVDHEKDERERGNALFARGDFEGAIRSYTRCVGMDSKNAVAFSNRAMAYIKLKEFSKAEADCDAALHLDSGHVKSLHRRAVARNALGKHRAALRDLQTAAEIDPTSKEIRKDIGKTTETLKTVARRAPKQRIKVESEPLPAPKPRPSIGKSEEHVPLNTVQAEANPRQLQGPVTNTNDADKCTIDASKGVPIAAPPCDTVCGPGSPLRRGGDELSRRKESPTDGGTGISVEGTGAARGDISSQRGPSEPSSEDAVIAMKRDEMMSAVSPPCAQARECNADAPLGEAASSTPPTPPPEVTPANLFVSGASTSTGRAIEEMGRAGATAEGIDCNDDPKVSEPDGCEQIVESSAPSSDTLSASPESMHPRDGGSLPSSRGISPVPSSSKPQHTSKPRMRKHPNALVVSAEKRKASSQVPVTGYQLEHMWRSASSSDERVKLLQSIPLKSVSKMFGKTPLELELLEGILGHLNEAFLPDRPATTLRWLKSLSTASRFAMTMSLMGEGEGRGAVREVLERLRNASQGVDVEEIENMRRQYLC